MPSSHTIHRHYHHFGWDNANVPALVVAPGDTVELETVDSSGAQLSADLDAGGLAALDFAKVNPVTGPVSVAGAEPGDALKVTILSFAPSGWGWTANIPGSGCWRTSSRSRRCSCGGTIRRVWRRPSTGPAGACRSSRSPARSAWLRPSPACTASFRPGAAATWTSRPRRRHRALPAGRGRGGGLFSVGDTHAAQGDGEVCGTAIEEPDVAGAAV